jgi:2-polyprenyl-3-methyl-5-hydroxy-6-metoxy-1,4-benzoquinol methylase
MPESISHIVDLVIRLDPESILDVGIGYGKWGVLCREYTDIRHGRYGRKQWRVKIDGIEIFRDYTNPVWDSYSRVIIADATKVAATMKNYDLVLLLDIIEHFEKQQAIELIQECQKQNRAVIINTPNGKYEQGACFGNVREAHRSFFTKEDFPDWECKLIANNLIALWVRK